MKTPQRHRRHRQPRADGGFVLLEAIVSIALITILMTALTALFVSTMKVTNHQRTNQSAVRLATDLMDQARSAGTQDCTGTGTPACPALQVLATQPAPTISSITYTPTYALSWCDVPAATGVPSCGNSGPKPFVQVAITLKWDGNTCAPGGCTYQTSMILSAKTDPLFFYGDSGGGPGADVAFAALGNQRTAMGKPVNLQLTCSKAPCTFSASGLPDGLSLDGTGKVSGTANIGKVYKDVSITLTDQTGTASTKKITWYVLSFEPPVEPLLVVGKNPCTLANVDLQTYVHGQSSSVLTFSVAPNSADGMVVSLNDSKLTISGNCNSSQGTKPAFTISVTDSGDGAAAKTARGIFTFQVQKSK